MASGTSVIGQLTSTRRGAILLGIAAAALAAVLLAIYITQYRSSVSGSSGPAPALVAKRLIASGTPGSVIAVKQLYTTTTVPSDLLKVGAISDPALLNGRVTAVDIYPGQQLTEADFSVGGTTTGVTAALAGNQRAVTIAIDPLRGNLNSLQTGDHVDIYQQLTGSNGQVVKLFRSNVRVLQAPGSTATEGTADVILQVPSRDVADLMYATAHTELQFALRPATGATPTVPRTASQATMLYSRPH